MKLVMFKRVKPRGFNYRPIHYDPVQEERENRRKELLGEDARSPLDSGEPKEYHPGQYIQSGGIRRSRQGISSRLVEKQRTSTIRSIIALGVLVAVGVWLYAGTKAALIALAATAIICFVALRTMSIVNSNRNRE